MSHRSTDIFSKKSDIGTGVHIPHLTTKYLTKVSQSLPRLVRLFLNMSVNVKTSLNFTNICESGTKMQFGKKNVIQESSNVIIFCIQFSYSYKDVF